MINQQLPVKDSRIPQKNKKAAVLHELLYVFLIKLTDSELKLICIRLLVCQITQIMLSQSGLLNTKY